jgi:PAS domain S-box-containing protein
MRASMASVGTLLGGVLERVRTAETLRKSEEHLQATLDAAPDAIITIDRHGVIRRVNPQTEIAFGYTTDELVGQNVRMLMPTPYREEHDLYIARYLETREPHIIGLGRVVRAQRKDGQIFPIDLAINEVAHIGLFVGIIRDISRHKELEKEVSDAAANEQRRIGQDIHDGVGQELTGLRYMAQTHAESLAQQSSPEAKTAERMTQWLTTVQQQLRAIIRQLVPVEVDNHGLAATLRGLARQISQSHDLVCDFQCQRPIDVADAALATHLYRIAQEALANAVRHAHATHIGVELTENKDALRLQVTDDGIGIPSSAEKMSTGIGLRSMAYRAGLIGANLTVRAREQGGTQVSCTVFRGEGNECDGRRMTDRQPR